MVGPNVLVPLDEFQWMYKGKCSLTLGNKPAKMQETDSDSNEPDADFLSKIFLGVVSYSKEVKTTSKRIGAKRILTANSEFSRSQKPVAVWRSLSKHTYYYFFSNC